MDIPPFLYLATSLASGLLQAVMEEDPVTVSLGPMGSLFRQLLSAMAWHYGRLKGVQSEIKFLGEGLEGLCTDAKDLSQTEDTITMCWVRQVRDLCYDTSDYLDELHHFIHYTSGSRPRNKNPSLRNCVWSKNFPVSRRPAWNQLRLSLPIVKKLKRVPLIAKLSALVARVEEADERRKRFKIAPPQASSSKHDNQQATGGSYLKPQLPLQLHVDNLINLLGFDHDHNERNLKVVTIFGSEGVGKTAVSRTLYQKYQRRFKHRAFLRVSRDLDMRRLLDDFLSQIKAPPPDTFSGVELQIATINKHLQGKSYFIVIDDLWDTSLWDIISHALPHGDYCRIITTTQIEDVARACCSAQLKNIYVITPLNDQSGMSEDATDWMKEAINVVYNNLPPHLKTCLLYMNIYPEGWAIKKGELVKQWVAEDFIRSVQGQDTEETAGCYFDALVSTGMVQSIDTNHKDEVLSYTLNHMVLDLIRQKCMEENFVTIVNYFQTIIGLPDKVRRLSVQLGGAKGANNISGNMRISQVRSLIFCGFSKSVPSIIEYGILQVLILHIWSDQDGILDLTRIGELYRLRYLKIKCSIPVKLPCKIRSLRQLGTLQVDSKLYVVPSDIVYLEKLLHLSLPSDSILPLGVGRMTCLRTLGCFDLGFNSEDNVRGFGELKNLEDLQLTCYPVQPAECLEGNVQLLLGSVLKKLSMLQSLTLVPAARCSNTNISQDGPATSAMSISCDASSSVFPAAARLRRLELSRHCCIFVRLPMWIGELAQLCTLKIAVGRLFKEDIGVLNGLPALASLSLYVATRSTERIAFLTEGFSVLRYFKFTCNAPWMEFEAGAMPNLEKLKLCFNSPIVDEDGTTRTIIIGRLLGLKELSAIIGGAGVEAESAWWIAIRNDPNNPEVQLTGPIYYGDKGRCMVTREGFGEDGSNRVDIRVADGAEETDWSTAESSLKNAIPLHPMVDSQINLVRRADLIDEEYLAGKTIEESNKDIKQNFESEIPIEKTKGSTSRLMLELQEVHKLVLMLVTLAANMTYQTAMNPPDSGSFGHQGGSPIHLDAQARWYKVFLYCNSVALVASVVLMVMLLSKHPRIRVIHKLDTLQAVMILDLLSLVAAYVVRCCPDVRTFYRVISMAASVLVYILIHMVLFMRKHGKEGKALNVLLQLISAVRSTCEDVTFFSSEKEDEEEHKTMKKKRKLLLLLTVFTASITYQAGVTPPVFLATNYPPCYAAFFYCNTTSFMSSIAAIILLVNPNLYKLGIQCNMLYVCAFFGLAGAYAAVSSSHMQTSVVLTVLVSLLSALWLLDKKTTRKMGIGIGHKEASIESTRVEDQDLSRAASNRDEGQISDKKTPIYMYTVRKYMMIVAILVAGVTYEAVLTAASSSTLLETEMIRHLLSDAEKATRRRVWPYRTTKGHAAGNLVLLDSNKLWYGLFFDSNSVLFITSVLVILLLLLDEHIDLHRLGVGDLLLRLHAWVRRASLNTHPRATLML